MKFLFQTLFAPGEGEGTGAGGTGTGAPATGDGKTTTGAPSTGTPATGQGQGQGAAPRQGTQEQGQGQGQGTQFTYKEDRSKWIPPHRLKETETATEKRIRAELQAEIDKRQKTIQALSGATPPPGRVDPEVQQAREAFFEVFPEFKPLLDAFGPEGAMDAIKELIENRGNLIQSASHTWDSLGGRHLTRLWDAAKDAMGLEKDLTEGQKGKLFAAFKQEISENEEYRRRYRAEDPTLVVDFVKSWMEDFNLPVQTKTLSPAARAARQPLPNNRGGGGRQLSTNKPKPIPAGDMDAALDAAVDYMKGQGTEFTE